jgi:hypothetical protein
VKKPAILWTQPWAKPHRMFGNDRKPTTLGFIGNWDSFSQHFSSVHWFFSPLKKSKCPKKTKKHHPTIGDIIADPGIIWNSSDFLRSPFGHQF